MTRSEAGAEALVGLGAAVARVSAFDAPGVNRALRESRAEAVIDGLTALPQNPADMAAAADGDRRLRLEGGGYLLAAALALGVRRYVQQASGFFLRPGAGLGDESEKMAVDASPRVAESARTYAELEARLSAAGDIEGVVLRYGFYYGPGTWYHTDGAAADLVQRQQIPVIGIGEGVWSWIHIDDAVAATVEALTVPPGVYHVVDDDPSPMWAWLPAFARSVGAPPPPRVTIERALMTVDADAVYYATRLRGASNAKAKRAFAFRPRRLEWLNE
jgi:nucleoside-diphosphate-sugar epimerase